MLQGVLDSARSLTAARYGVITLLDDAGGIPDFLSSGMTGEEAGRLWDLPDGMRLFEYLGSIAEPLRLPDLLGHIRSMGLPELRPPLPVGQVVSFLAAPVLHLGQRVGNIYLAEKEAGEEFTGEDEETLVMFASQAAMVIANARRHRDEQRGQGGPGDPDQHLSGGRGRLRCQDGSAGVVQPGRRRESSTACGSRTSRRSSSWAC